MTFNISTLEAFEGPKYKALADAIEQAIQRGELLPGEKLPTHRYLADQLNVTVGTITRGYAEAERRQLLTSKVGSGTYVRDNNDSSLFYYTETLESDQLNLTYSMALSGRQPEILEQAMKQIQSDHRLMTELLDYHPVNGLQRHNRAFMQWLQHCGIENIRPDNMIITSGGQHGFFSSLMALTQPGDTVICEGLSYPGFISAAHHLHLKLIGLEFDDRGLTPEALSLACQRYRPRVLYVASRMANPIPVTMGIERLTALAHICRQHDIWIIDDDTQGGALGPTDAPSFHTVLPERTILISSLSKVFGGGLRMGVIHAPDKLVSQIGSAVRSTNWMSSPILAELASQLIMDGSLAAIRQEQFRELERRHALTREWLGDFNLTQNHGFNVWLKLPGHWRAATFMEALDAEGIRVKTAEVFAAGQYAAPQAVRFCIGGKISFDNLRVVLEKMNTILSQKPALFSDLTI
ncbi:PLP-dependent aminotransferase family protein [Gynuella sp.]|uniref:aminotransferase-like domain-containing protein n=1 Tax=Gynuella sp. TaxID=2969146 RepID=UPI003D115213